MTHLDTGDVEINGGRLEFDVAGDGPPVVFLHPGLWDRRTWDDQFGLFSKTYRVVRYDARGYGRSSRPEPGYPYSHVEDLAAVMDAAPVDRAALVGCSMGGGIPGSDHVVNMRQPSEFNRVVLEFLGEVL
ncbi:MAG: alpha/beta fold hydrolase [Actinomycetota bacterium]